MRIYSSECAICCVPCAAAISQCVYLCRGPGLSRAAFVTLSSDAAAAADKILVASVTDGCRLLAFVARQFCLVQDAAVAEEPPAAPAVRLATQVGVEGVAADAFVAIAKRLPVEGDRLQLGMELIYAGRRGSGCRRGQRWQGIIDGTG